MAHVLSLKIVSQKRKKKNSKSLQKKAGTIVCFVHEKENFVLLMCEACPKVVLCFETDANLSQVPSDNKNS